MEKEKRYFIPILVFAMIGLLAVSCSQNRELQESASYNMPAGTAEKVQNASQVVDDFVSPTGMKIPANVLRKSAGIAIIPQLTSAAFIAGGSHGSGVLLTHNQNQWSLPVFMSITGGSLGAQIGITTTDLLLVFMNPDSIAKIKSGNFTLGANVTVAAGPVGGSADLSTISADVLAYRRTEGAFAGVALTGNRLSLDKDRTLEYYATASPVRGYYGQEGDQIFNNLMNPNEKVNIQNIPPGAMNLRQKLDKLTSGASGS